MKKTEETITNRYQIIDILGQGGLATTYKALDTKTNIEVAVKTISLRGIRDWKQIELFEREAKILQQLDHRGIPKYIDYFEIDTEKERYFYLVQQLAPGKSLYELINDGWNPDEQEVKKIASSILKILIYLQELSPPIIHRDIKPQNIIRQENGEVFLVDFGAVADVHQHTFNSTIVGTFGYMSPEQYRGKATLATDIYGLGATLIFLLTKKCPAELPQHHLSINFRPYVNINNHFTNWLEKCISPNPKQRFQDAIIALEALDIKNSFKLIKILEKPKKSLIKSIAKNDKLIILIPSIKEIQNSNIAFSIFANLPFFLYAFLFFIFISVVFISDSQVLLSFIIISLLNGLFFVFASLFILITFIFLKYWFKKKRVVIICPKNHLDLKIKSKSTINESVKAQFKRYKFPFSQKYITYCLLICKLKPQYFGFFLTRRENEWLVQEINSFLGSKNI